jgi:hypothetical protein
LKPKLAQRLLMLLLALAALLVVPDGLVSRGSATTGDFAVSASPNTLSLAHGALSTLTITISGQGGYRGNISLTTAGTYGLEISVLFSPSILEVNATHQIVNSDATILVYQWTVPGNYIIDVEAYDGVVQHTVQIDLTVTGQDFAITSSPTRLDFPLDQNKTENTSVTVASLGGFSGMVNLTISVGSNYPPVLQIPSGSPSSKDVSISPTASATFQLAISVNSSMVAHAYVVQITGVGATTTRFPHNYEFTIVIGPDFNMSMSTRNLFVRQGGTAVSTLNFASINDFVGSIGYYSGLIPVDGPNPNITFVPNGAIMLQSGGANSSSILVRADSRTGIGTYSVGIEANEVTGPYDYYIGEFLPYTITVAPPMTPPDFIMYADPARLSTSLGSTVNSTINLIGNNGFAGSVTLSASSQATTSLNPGSVTVSSTINKTSTLTVNIPGPISNGGLPAWWYASGVYSVNVTASDASGFSHTSWVNVTATPFSIQPRQTQLRLVAGSAATVDLTVNGIGEFNDTVTLSASEIPVLTGTQMQTIAPLGLTATLSNSLLNFSRAPSSLSSTLTINTLSETPGGDYVIQVTATYMRPDYYGSSAPKTALSYTLPVHILVTSSTGSSTPTVFGLEPIEFYGIIATVAVAIAISSSYLVLRRQRRMPASRAYGLEDCSLATEKLLFLVQ